MTAQHPSKPDPRPRKIARRTLVALLILAVGSLWLLMACGEDWKRSLYTFDVAGEKYRVRVTGGHFGPECVKAEHYAPHTRYNNWSASAKDCAWVRVAGGDGWLAGGQAVEVRPDERTEGWIFFGIVPAAATEVVLTLDGAAPHRIPTKAGGDGENRFYAFVQSGAEADLIGLQLHDAQGGELRVF